MDRHWLWSWSGSGLVTVLDLGRGTEGVHQASSAIDPTSGNEASRQNGTSFIRILEIGRFGEYPYSIRHVLTKTAILAVLAVLAVK